MDETLCKFILTLIGLLIVWTLIIKVPARKLKSFRIQFRLFHGFELNGEFYRDKDKQ